MTFTDTYMDLGGTVYTFAEIGRLPDDKDSALLRYLAMVSRSWTFARMTDTEKENCMNTFLDSARQGLIKGGVKQRWATMDAMYSAFLAALDYGKNPADWRGDTA